MPQKRKIQREEYLSFFDMVHSSRISEGSVMRLYRAIDQFILHILFSDLFFISVDYGRRYRLPGNSRRSHEIEQNN